LPVRTADAASEAPTFEGLSNLVVFALTAPPELRWFLLGFLAGLGARWAK
jgi:hypothetical protein